MFKKITGVVCVRCAWESGEKTGKIDINEIYKEMAKLNKYESEEDMRRRFPEDHVREIVGFFSNPNKSVRELAEIAYKIYDEADRIAASYGYDERTIERIATNGNKMIVYVAGGRPLVYWRKNGSII